MIFTKKDQLEILEHALSWIVSLAMFIYGGAKLIQFKGAAAVDKTVAEMTGMELMWAFYGYSQAFAIILGVLELIGGTLMLFKKTRLIGCLFSSTILVNIILQDIVFGVHLGALKAAILYQLIIFWVLYFNRVQVLQSIRALMQTPKLDQSRQKFLLKLAIAFVLFVGLRVLEYFITVKG